MIIGPNQFKKNSDGSVAPANIKYSISYKRNQTSFELYNRKYMHNLSVQVNDRNFEGSKAIEVPTMNVFIVNNRTEILLFDLDSFKEVGKIPIDLAKT